MREKAARKQNSNGDTGKSKNRMERGNILELKQTENERRKFDRKVDMKKMDTNKKSYLDWDSNSDYSDAISNRIRGGSHVGCVLHDLVQHLEVAREVPGHRGQVEVVYQHWQTHRRLRKLDLGAAIVEGLETDP